jgi:hypothetical protein
MTGRIKSCRAKTSAEGASPVTLLDLCILCCPYLCCRDVSAMHPCSVISVHEHQSGVRPLHAAKECGPSNTSQKG